MENMTVIEAERILMRPYYYAIDKVREANKMLGIK